MSVMARMAWMGLLIVVGCAIASHPLPRAWETVPRAAVVDRYCEAFDCAAKPQTTVRIKENQLFRDTVALTPRFEAIDSFDVSLDRKEVVFSARRKDNFDVGLVSLDGSDIHWIPNDPADEVGAQWAPRGNKVSFIVRTATGSLVRTVHVPTATPLSVDFPANQIDALAWEPQAEQFAVVVESPDSSQSLISMTYAGEKRRVVVPPSSQLDVSLEPIGGVLVMRPSAVHYNERLPLVVWLDHNPFAWSDARAALMRNARVAIAITPATTGDFWSEIAKVTWIDAGRTYVVGNEAGGPHSGAVVVRPDPSLPPHRYARTGNNVSAGPAVVQSFAAAFIADDLKGTPPPNGSR
jgi:hypothetical protein